VHALPRAAVPLPSQRGGAHVSQVHPSAVNFTQDG
jgi:hypothetical protein